MQINIRNVWLLFLPVAALLSWAMREPPSIAVVKLSSNSMSLKHANKFQAMEEVLSMLYVIDHNKLVINSQTEKYLSQVITYMDVEFDRTLVEKSFPSSNGKKMLQLIDCYKAYKQTEQQLSQHYLNEQAPDQMLDYRKLQRIFFDETSFALFSEHHNFYEGAKAAGSRLIEIASEGIPVSSACTEVRNFE